MEVTLTRLLLRCWRTAMVHAGGVQGGARGVGDECRQVRAAGAESVGAESVGRVKILWGGLNSVGWGLIAWMHSSDP